MQMGVQQSEGGGKDNNGGNDSRKSRRRLKKILPVQRLYDTCKEVFADCGPGIVPSPEKVERLAAVLDGITQVDVGLRPNMPFFSSRWAPNITYLPLHESDEFSIALFCLPQSSVISLHNHPGMTVFSKLLFGTMHIKAYDWFSEPDKGTDCSFTNINPTKSEVEGLRLAKLKVDSELTAPCRPSILYPADGGNMHCFTAKTACAVLDVLGPPYSDPDGRHCQYYQDFPFNHFPVETEGRVVSEEEMVGYAWLKEVDKPEEFPVVGVPYNGPQITRK